MTMQIFIQPMYSKQELNSDSNYALYAQFIRTMNQYHPDWHFVLPFPDAKSGYKYDNDGLFSLSNVTRLPQRISPRKMAGVVSYDGTWYDELFRKFGFDVIWCNQVETAAAIGGAGVSTYEVVGRPFLCVAHHYTIHESLPYPFDSMANVAMYQMIGALAGEINVFDSEHCRWMFFDTVKRWLNSESLDAIEKKSRLINHGPLESALTYSPTSNDIPVIIYNHRLQGYKNYKATFELLDEIYKEGIKFRVKYTSSSAERTGYLAQFPFVDIRFCPTRMDYLKELRGGDLNVTNSLHETFCISAVESMALGQPLIAPDGVTFPEITGALAYRRNHADGLDYPFLFHDRAEQKKMLISLLTNPELRREWGQKVSNWVRGHYTAEIWVKQYCDLFEEHTKVRLGTPDDVREMVRQKIRENSGATTREMFTAISNGRVDGRQPLSNQSLPMTKLLRLARELGATVRVENGIQRIYSD